MDLASAGKTLGAIVGERSVGGCEVFGAFVAGRAGVGLTDGASALFLGSPRIKPKQRANTSNRMHATILTFFLSTFQRGAFLVWTSASAGDEIKSKELSTSSPASMVALTQDV